MPLAPEVLLLGEPLPLMPGLDVELPDEAPVPDAPLLEAPELPEVSLLDDGLELLGVDEDEPDAPPIAPELPELPEVPEVPELPEVSLLDDGLELLGEDEPDAPLPIVPELPELPDMPEAPVLPAVPASFLF